MTRFFPIRFILPRAGGYVNRFFTTLRRLCCLCYAFLMSVAEARLAEIFTSIQGEGLYVGERQTFVRFAGCNLSCAYCDTPETQSVTQEFRVEITPAKKDFQRFPNPASASRVIELIASLQKPKGAAHSVALTGGEPLLQTDFLKGFLPALKKEIGLPIYLETNGVLPDHLAEVIGGVDIIAFDIKLPGATGLSAYWKEHRKALEIACQKEVFVKIVFTPDSKAKEIDEAVALIADVNENIPLVLQPVTPHGSIKHRPHPDQMLAFQAIAKRRLKCVRVIPQVHKMLGLL
jgi:7-carboxy-7-deazaguanine synthase